MKTDTSEAKKINEILKEAEGHPMVKAILAEKAEKVLAERLLASAKLRTATEEAERIIPELQLKLDALVVELADYDAARKAITDKLTAARIVLMNERLRLDREKSEAEAALLGNYDQSIDEALQFFRDSFDALRVKNISLQQRTGDTNPFTETKEIFLYSNLAAIKKAMEYCRAGIKELEKMKVAPDLDADRIEALRKNIPNADELAENVGEKPMKKGPDVGYLARLYQKMDARITHLLGKKV